MLRSLRSIPYLIADGPSQMAVDEFMLEQAQAGEAAVRLYGWEPATLSLGYFQSARDRKQNYAWKDLPWVRRSTGGGAILHGTDLTYALALPEAAARIRRPADWHCLLHRRLAETLVEAGLGASVLGGARPAPQALGYLCFAVPQPGDVMLGQAKIIGGAQRLKQGALLQHGSIYPPAAEVLRDRLPVVMAELLQCPLEERPFAPEERSRIRQIAEEKFLQSAWNDKR